MASYSSKVTYPDFVQYYLTLYDGDDGMTYTHGESLPSSQQGLELSYPGPTSYLTGDVCQTSGPCNEYTAWIGIQSFFNSYWGEDQSPYGAGLDTSEPPHDSSFMDKTEAACLGEANCNYGYDNEVEMQPCFDHISWSGDEYGSKGDWHECSNIGGVGWDEKKFCESIFGYWPCLFEQNLESYVEERLDSDLSPPISYL